MNWLRCLLIVVITVVLCCSLSLPGMCESKTFALWQLPSQTPSQMMSYVIRTVHGHVIAIDGGNTGDASYLMSFLGNLGGRVDAWFITHPHPDHMDALTEIMKSSNSPIINRIYASLPDEDFIRSYEADYLPSLTNFNQMIEKSGRCVINLVLGAHFEIDGVRIDVLAIRNPELHMNAINNSSVVLRVSDQCKSVLFLADLGLEGGEKLLHSKYAKMLKSDYVQMAHHGQNGVTKDVYEAIKPSTCLWTAPDWLWDNNSGKGKGSGPWKTLEVRKWMEDMRITKNFVIKDGLCKID